MSMMQKFFGHMNFLTFMAVAAYIVGIVLIFFPHKLLKHRGIVSPKRTKIARIFGFVIIAIIDIIVVTWYLLNLA